MPVNGLLKLQKEATVDLIYTNNKFPQLGNIGYQDNFQSQTKTSTDP